MTLKVGGTSTQPMRQSVTIVDADASGYTFKGLMDIDTCNCTSLFASYKLGDIFDCASVVYWHRFFQHMMSVYLYM